MDPENHPEAAPANWHEAVSDLIASRVELIRLESLAAGRAASRKAVLAVVLAVAALFAWALLMAGGIALLAATSNIAWPWLALAVSALHLLVALIAAAKLRRPDPTPFPVTRAEFQRDREWLKNLHQPKP